MCSILALMCLILRCLMLRSRKMNQQHEGVDRWFLLTFGLHSLRFSVLKGFQPVRLNSVWPERICLVDRCKTAASRCDKRRQAQGVRNFLGLPLRF